MKRALSTFMFVLLLVSMLTFSFNLQSVKATDGTIYIKENGSIDPSDAPISTVDNVTYTLTGNITSDADGIVIERNNTVVNGTGYTLQGIGNGKGIDLSGRSNVTIKNMRITTFYYGIYLYYSSNYNSISGNNITNNGDGINLYSSSNNTISGNNITANKWYGIYHSSSSGNSISGNNITANNWGGIGLVYSSNYNRIYRNNITNNVAGIWIFSSLNNSIFRNNFINNAQQVYSTDSANFWNNRYMDSSGGNYWSNYAGVDSFNGRYQNINGSDGIGDTPYNITANNQDEFPLMNPWPPAPSSPGYYETSEYLIGSVAVGVVFLESNGTIDTSTEDWGEREAIVVSKIESGLSWLASNNTEANVSFVYDVHYGVPTRYEPINRPSTDSSLWISEAMVSLGYYGTIAFDQVRDYINALRKSRGVDWSFAIFVVDSLNDSDGCFTDPIDQTRNWSAFAYLGGPLLVMTYDNDNYTIENMDYVTTHETCHIFYATDEYDGITETSGYLGIQDWEGSNDTMEIQNTWLCTYSQQQLGWRDSDGDGIQDIVDTFPDTILNPYSPDPTNRPTLTYTGTVTEIPYTNNNPYGKGRDVTINTITYVEFRVDNGTWNNATSDDGSFDEFEESFNFTTARLSPGTHIIEVRGINSVGNNETTYASDEVTMGIPGDINADGVVDIYDLVTVAVAYGSTPTDPNWNPNADINGDGKIDIYDVVIACVNYGQTIP